ncbi:hypothetical protein MPER_05660, partial [Moniliophthora perniciosa FA553]
ISAEKQSDISRELGSFDSSLSQKQPSSKLLKANVSAAVDEPSEGDQNTETMSDDDLSGILAAVVLHPSFRETVTKIAENDLTQRGINLAQYPIQNSVATGSQQGLLNILGSVLGGLLSIQANGSALGGFGLQNGIQANGGVGYYPGQPLPAEVQQGIFDAFTTIIKNPIFTNVITGIVNGIA